MEAPDEVGTARVEPEWSLLQDWFLASAQKYPENIAIDSEEESNITGDSNNITGARMARQQFSYREVARLTYVVATWLLSEKGLQPNDVVVIRDCPRGLHAYVCILATLRAGGCYCYVDPDFPEDRVAFIISDCQPAVVLDRNTFDKAEKAGEDSYASVFIILVSEASREFINLRSRGLLQ